MVVTEVELGLHPELEPAHGPVEVVELKPHLRNQVLHASNRIDDLNGLGVGVVPHLYGPTHVLGDPAPESRHCKVTFKGRRHDTEVAFAQSPSCPGFESQLCL